MGNDILDDIFVFDNFSDMMISYADVFQVYPSLSNKRFKNIASFAASDKSIYSASVVLRITHDCFDDCHVMEQFPIEITNPV